MTLGAAIFLAAVGAILYFAVDDTVSGIDIHTIGLILMIAGAVGFVISTLIQLMGRERRTERIVERPGEPSQREEIRERY
jgi:hypothetical protein